MTMANSTTTTPATAAAAESAAGSSRIPVTLRRASSLRLKGERCYHRTHNKELFPAITENADGAMCSSPQRTPQPLRRANSSLSLKGFGDTDSVRSFGSNCSGSNCEHAHFALNGTTWSARSRRYVVHQSPNRSLREPVTPTSDYLTPTQRNARQLRELQAQLAEARVELEQRDCELARLTRELVELRLRGPNSDEDASSRAEVAPTSPRTSPTNNTNSPPDPDDYRRQSGLVAGARHFEQRIDEMQRRHLDETQQLRQAHHDRLEGLLDQLAELSARYVALEQARARERELETELERAKEQLRECQAELAQRDEKQRRACLEMYAKRPGSAEPVETTVEQKPEKKISVAELLRQLTDTQTELDNVKTTPSQSQLDSSCVPPPGLALACRSQSLLSLQEAVSLWVLGTRKAMYRRVLETSTRQNDPEITLQFLKSAIYYFLTDKENLQGHLNAIESILGFTDSEKLVIDRIYRAYKK